MANLGSRWRSSPIFILTSVAVGMISNMFLYGFMVPILPYILEERVKINPSNTSTVTILLLAQNALISTVCTPTIGLIHHLVPSKRVFLIVSLLITLLSSGCMAASRSVYGIMVGRFLQALADSCMKSTGFSTVAEHSTTFPPGSLMRLLNMAVSTGTSAGPMMSGLLLQKYGYWTAWSSVFLLLFIDLVFRLLVDGKSAYYNGPTAADVKTEEVKSDDEETPLLAAPSVQSVPDTASRYQCYLILRQRPFLAVLVHHALIAILLASFDAALPLHVRQTFAWGSAATGLLFSALQTPSIFLTPLFDWLGEKKRKKSEAAPSPTLLGFLLLAPCFALLGLPGHPAFPSLGSETLLGQALYIVSVVLVGVLISSLAGTAAAQTTSTVKTMEGMLGKTATAHALSMVAMSSSLGMVLGPIVSGILMEKLGYLAMNCFWVFLIIITIMIRIIYSYYNDYILI
ncbi:hypothetical protein ASPZODRAFT_137262 [Penicilliopsis zonata CBS 506.65]|uniref:Major facilitator superfamily (MFS) profile domain-containing protein n=1 Tax=Penicilliopsis zonata CBS 506.65 TaxID=1073090 RepID=A0A1L9S5N0_9EURO|nr:hypothetical protein ASPZODRAFT_137262 [Penicilliopsis zonata CBS 506.65]OJJ42450.1 hypothetical protein ASPZODRAFT_137262 [Penicilliopsis zonata CBS 506.65]